MSAISGIDWAAEWHDVHIADQDGRPLTERRFSHDEAGVSALIALLLEHRVARVAIERPDGLLVGRMLAAGICVLAIHPNQVAAARERFRAAAGKSDRFDAFVLCELARTDHHRFAALAPSSDETVAVRVLVRTREDLIGVRVHLANQLRAELDASWPGARRIFADVDTPIALAFLARYPSPNDARGLGPKRLQGFLARHAYSGRRPVDELLDRLQSAPIASLGELQAKARRSSITGLVAALTPIVEQISQLTSQIARAIHTHPDGQIFLSFFKDPKSVICAAGLLAEIGDNRARYPTPDSLAADAGQAPVAKESGKHRHATFRWACDKRLRGHIGTLADSTRHWHPWAHDVYGRARARGAQHPHATRILGRAWTRILWRCWQNHTPYDPTQHGNLNRLLEAKG
ncbi:MAG: IS110 family transposase [Actinobacteria bacterium]|nr:IS110 family transposase [Actinomycetota bacterium]